MNIVEYLFKKDYIQDMTDEKVDGNLYFVDLEQERYSIILLILLHVAFDSKYIAL